MLSKRNSTKFINHTFGYVFCVRNTQICNFITFIVYCRYQRTAKCQNATKLYQIMCIFVPYSDIVWINVSNSVMSLDSLSLITLQDYDRRSNNKSSRFLKPLKDREKPKLTKQIARPISREKASQVRATASHGDTTFDASLR